MSLSDTFLANARTTRSKARHYREQAMAEPNPVFRQDHLEAAKRAEERAADYEMRASWYAKPAIERAA